ncbi:MULTISPECIES: hypothetical protein [Chitinophaga]|uniref:hypothetical protein n=1 Tax=Chitinophaga TaxID=79328 RepID=UPI001454F6E8|nr:hypothetical protein [Chitinophaga ginsengisegetis]MDR6568091.1 hypothetical protein [Chitinophaga ginsengisegetis]MDR6647354.1 hypothetical protein [Chitinophaga ginsengisegetis]MDR6653704.1 hypothetical protein [Chitinophaga ginsengisegetis]
MLFKQEHLEGISSGKVSLAFRKWEKRTVNKGSLINTGITSQPGIMVSITGVCITTG